MINPWLVATLASVTIGVAAGLLARPERATLYGAVIPWLGVLAFNLSTMTSRGGALWPISQLLAGTFAAVVGAAAARGVRNARQRRLR